MLVEWIESLQGIHRDIFISVLSAVVGAVISGLFTYIFTRRKEKREDKEKRCEESKEAFEKRPEMEIADYINGIEESKTVSEKPADVECVVLPIQNVTVDDGIVNVHFNPRHLQKDAWVFVEYTLKNMGKTNISALDIVCNSKQTTCLFPLRDIGFYTGHHILNYHCCYDRIIRTENSVTIKIYYPKEEIRRSVLSSVLSVQMEDENHCCWTQPLFAPDNKIYQSCRLSKKEYSDNFRIEPAEECFRKPELW